MFPDSINLEEAFKMDHADTIQLALDTAEIVMGVPKLLDAPCTAVCPEERSVMTQVSEFFQKISKVRAHIDMNECVLVRADKHTHTHAMVVLIKAIRLIS